MIVEVLIAIGVFAIVATFMANALAGGMRGVLTGKHREVATQEGNRILEIARSLTFNAIGLAQPPADPTIDTDAAVCDPTPGCGSQVGQYSYRSAATWEPLVWVVNPTGHPFNPHVATVTRGSTALKRYAYVTGVDSDGDGTIDLKRVLVRVTWGEGEREEIRAQTLINERGAIPDGGTTPLTATSVSSAGALSIDSAILGLSPPLDVKLPASTGSSVFRAISTLNCTTKSASVYVPDAVDVPSKSVTVTADDDTRTGTAATPPDQSDPGALTIAAPASTLIGPTISSPIACEADADDFGHQLGTGSQLGSTLTAITNITDVGDLTVASIATLPITQQIDHELVSSQRETYARAASAAGAASVLKLPITDGIPDGLVQVDGLSYSASVRGSGATPSAAPAVTGATFTVRIFDEGTRLGADCTTGLTLPPGVSVTRSNDYCVFTVAPTTSGFVDTTIPVDASTFSPQVGLSLTYSSQVKLLAPTKSPLAGVTGPNGEKRWTAEYTPLSIEASLDGTRNGDEVINADVDLNLGNVKAYSCAGATCE